jgi:hypothetical protein
MTGVRTFTKLTLTEQLLIVRTLLLVAFVRLGLWLVSVERLRKLLTSCACLLPKHSVDRPVGRLVWAVQASSRRVPMATCLTQSLSLHCLLQSAGLPSKIRLGVLKQYRQDFQAHAWVEYLGQPLLSTPSEVNRYVSLCSVGDDPV